MQTIYVLQSFFSSVYEINSLQHVLKVRNSAVDMNDLGFLFEKSYPKFWSYKIVLKNFLLQKVIAILRSIF